MNVKNNKWLRNLGCNLVMLVLGSVLLVGCGGQRVQEQNQSQSKLSSAQAFRLCNIEGAQSMLLARDYMLFSKRDKAIFEKPHYQSAHAKQQSQALFGLLEANKINHYSQFAAIRLYECADKYGLNVGQPIEKAKLCYARSDVPFFLGVQQSVGDNKEAAVGKVQRMFKGQSKLYPAELIQRIADYMYSDTSSAKHKITDKVFWNCMNHS